LKHKVTLEFRCKLGIRRN